MMAKALAASRGFSILAKEAAIGRAAGGGPMFLLRTFSRTRLLYFFELIRDQLRHREQSVSSSFSENFCSHGCVKYGNADTPDHRN